eukprot:3489738-Prymnesium_polylepis.1
MASLSWSLHAGLPNSAGIECGQYRSGSAARGEVVFSEESTVRVVLAINGFTVYQHAVVGCASFAVLLFACGTCGVAESESGRAARVVRYGLEAKSPALDESAQPGRDLEKRVGPNRHGACFVPAYEGAVSSSDGELPEVANGFLPKGWKGRGSLSSGFGEMVDRDSRENSTSAFVVASKPTIQDYFVLTGSRVVVAKQPAMSNSPDAAYGTVRVTVTGNAGEGSPQPHARA